MAEEVKEKKKWSASRPMPTGIIVVVVSLLCFPIIIIISYNDNNR